MTSLIIELEMLMFTLPMFTMQRFNAEAIMRVMWGKHGSSKHLSVFLIEVMHRV